MNRIRTSLLSALLLLAGTSAVSRADIVELVGGRAIQGKVLPGQSSEEGLAVELFDTGGVINVRWDHIIPARAKELRVQTGFEAPVTREVFVEGHRVLLTNGQVVEGKALNHDAKGEPLQLKTRSSVQSIERGTISRIDPVQLPGLFVYEPEDLYQIVRDENPPSNGAQHLELALVSMEIGALNRAKEHLDAAEADVPFASGPGGKNLPALRRQLDVLIKSKGAQDMAAQIKSAMRSNRSSGWNTAAKLVSELDTKYPDEAVRRVIQFDLLRRSVQKGRETFFRKEVQKGVYQAMTRFIEKQAREPKKAADPNAPRGVATPGSLGAAKQFMSKDLPKLIWDKVIADTGITPEEMDQFWKERSSKKVLTASYGTGSFIVVRRAPQQKGGGPDPSRPKGPAGSQRQQGGPPGPPKKEDKPLTEEEWWEQRQASDRVRWMTAWFVESSGMFEVVRTDETATCEGCAGTGVLRQNNTDGSVSTSICTTCNGAAKVRRVIYR
jgi:hypothetical protein